jgi:hypothetical protein
MRTIVAVFLVLLLVACSSKPQSPQTAKAATPTTDQTLVPPEVVRVDKVMVENGVKKVTVSNTSGTYVIACNASTEDDSCVTPEPNTDYELYTSGTKWKYPGAEKYVSLKFLQDYSSSYPNKENIGLITTRGETHIGMYWLESWSKKQ